jgi:hypothetical protein
MTDKEIYALDTKELYLLCNALCHALDHIEEYTHWLNSADFPEKWRPVIEDIGLEASEGVMKYMEWKGKIKNE